MARPGAVASRVVRAAAAHTLQRVGRPSADRVLYNSFNGRFADSPRAIYEELIRRDGATSHAWVASGTDGFPSGVTTMPLYSVRYQREAGRAGHIVSNLQMPTNLRKRPGTTYLQTWHGTPLKRIGFDNERWQRNPRGLARVERDLAKWDFLVSQNPFSTQIFRRAFRFEGEILETGYPRNDALNAPDAAGTRARVRKSLGIEDGRRAILYAPTWRDDEIDARGSLQFSIGSELERISAALGDDHVLLLRLHYLLAARFEDAMGGVLVNVSDHPDIRELYLAADVLITDYSSAMFDFAVTGKPIVFFTYDLDEYRDQVRGFYFDLEAEAPGPVCRTTDRVVEAVRAIDSEHTLHARRYVRFRNRFCPFDDGQAAARVVDRVFS